MSDAKNPVMAGDDPFPEWYDKQAQKQIEGRKTKDLILAYVCGGPITAMDEDMLVAELKRRGIWDDTCEIFVAIENMARKIAERRGWL